MKDKKNLVLECEDRKEENINKAKILDDEKNLNIEESISLEEMGVEMIDLFDIEKENMSSVPFSSENYTDNKSETKKNSINKNIDNNKISNKKNNNKKNVEVTCENEVSQNANYKKETKKISSKKEKKSKKKIIIIISLLIITAVLISAYFYIDSLAYKKVTIEAGVELNASELMKNKDPNAAFTEDSDALDIHKPGIYHLKVRSGYFNHKVVVAVQDTIAPSAEKIEKTIEFGQSVSANELVTNITDETDVTISYQKLPDYTVLGKQNITIVLEDLGRNKTTIESQLIILPFKLSLTGEAGSKKPSLEDFRLSSETFECVSGFDSIDMHHAKNYDLEFAFEDETYSVVYQVQDTVEPKVEFQNYKGFVGENISPEHFILSAKDETDLTYSIKEELKNEEGTAEYTVIVTDEGGNRVSEICHLTLEIDDEPPTAEISGDIEVYEGNSVSYLNNISVSDNCLSDLKIEVNSDEVNTDVPGTYPITYTVTDVGGNAVSVSCNVIVKERSYSMDEINQRADEILAEILTPEMTDYEKSWEIFDYVRKHVMFQDKSDKFSYVKACYEGVIEGHGDCYVYACTCQTLLTRAGIKNMMIERIPTRTTHFWNLVDYGEGWYHMDTTPRVPDHPTVFMWTEAEIQAYSAEHYRCYNYDHEQYPETN